MQHAPRTTLIGILSAGLGPHTASQIVNATADALGYGDTLTRAQVIHLLDRLIQRPGLVGVTAAFTKSQVVMWSDSPRRL